MPISVTVVGHQGASVRTDDAALLGAAGRERVRVEANRWIKRLRLVRYRDVPMRDRFTYRGDSLWWFTELYLHKMRRLEQALATVFTLDATVDAYAPRRLVVECDSAAEADAARAFGQARGIPVDVDDRRRPAPRIDAGLLVGVSALLSRLRPTARLDVSRTSVAAFVHTAFWRPGREGDGSSEAYIGAVLDAIVDRVPAGEVRLIGVGPRRNFRARRWWDPIAGPGGGTLVTPIEQLAPRRALTDSLALWRERRSLAGALLSGEDVRAAGFVGRYDLWPVLSAELRDAALVQWPWSARAMDEARASLMQTRPDVAVTYAEAGGWGRALVLEARRLSIPTVGLQHGFIYRHWLNYQHEDDELRPSGSGAGFPYPTRTLVFDRYAASTLETAGHLPPDAIRITGSPRLDELAARLRDVRAQRTTIRRDLAIADDQRLLVLVAKASEVGAHLPALFDAVRTSPGVRLIVKPHPAETAAAYRPLARPGDAVTIDDPHTDLGRLLAAADAMVTMNSTVAIDGLVLGVPALVIGLPNNLSPFVEAGVMMGAEGGGIRTAIAALLYDRPAREALLQRGAAFAERYAMRADGGSAARAADDILSFKRPAGTGA